MGLWYSKDFGFELISYSDADQAWYNDNCKSTSGDIQFLGDNLVIWSSKKQDCIAMSTAKAEYVSLSACCAQVIWMRTQLLDYGFRYTKIPMYCDSKSAIAISSNPTECQLADLFTKALPREMFEYLVHRIGIRRCNNYDVLQSIPCFPECKIVGKILFDHPLSYALTATADVPAVYLQQFWKTVIKMPDTEDTIIFKLYSQEIVYTLFHAMVNRINVDYAALLWWDFMNCVSQKKDVIQCHRFTKLIIADLIKKFSNISQRIDEDYQSIKDDIPLVSVYTTRNVLVRRMLIPDEFLTEEIRATDDYKESTPRAHRTPTLTSASPQGKKRKQSVRESSSPQKLLKITIRQKKVDEGEKDAQSYDDVDDFDNRLEPGSHKENPEYVDDDDDDDDKEEEKELKDTVSLLTPTTSKAPHKQRCISSKYNHLPDRDAFRYEVPNFISKEFNSHAPQIIEELFKQYIQNNVIGVHPTTITLTDTTSLADLHKQLYLKMKRSLQDRANGIALWEVLKHDDAPPKGEKRVKRQKTSKSSKSAREEIIIDEDEVILEDENVDKRVPTIFDHARIEATLNDMLSNQFKNAEEFPLERGISRVLRKDDHSIPSVGTNPVTASIT
ncbi:hypothetical protein Tco_0579240 [Tanacetum coccineum]